MLKKVMLIGTCTLLMIPTSYAAGHKGQMETCLKAALAKYPGSVLSLEAEIENKKPIYEFDIKGADGKEWEVECDAKTGKITEVEEEVDANDPRFASKAKVSLEDAKKAALAAVPGEVIENETSIESDGGLSYEFDIKTRAGKEVEVEIDAVTGKVLETEDEIYQVGLD